MNGGRYGLFCIVICSWMDNPGVASRATLNNKVSFNDLRVVINLGGGGSEIVAKQVPGRASRKIDGKDCAYIIEFRHYWDTAVVHTKNGRTREVAGPVFKDDIARMHVYEELGFEQVNLLNEKELPWIVNSNTPTP